VLHQIPALLLLLLLSRWCDW